MLRCSWRRTILLICSCLAVLPCAGQSRDPLPVPDVRGFQTLKCDFHMHTVFSDGEVWPTTRVAEAWREGLDAIAITDHAGYNPHKPDVSVDLSRPQALAAPLASRLGVLLVPAVEIMEGDTHFNVLFVTDPSAFWGLKLVDALKQGRAQNAFMFWNHPGWKQTADWFPNIDALYKEKLFDGVELVNGRSFYAPAFPWIEEKKLAILSNTDVHTPTLPSYQNRSRPLTLVFARTRDLDGIREALTARRTAAWMGGELWGSDEMLSGLWDGAVALRTSALSLRIAGPQAVIELQNRSAIPFQVRVVKAPAWLQTGAFELGPERNVARAVQASKDAPEGTQSVTLELEVTNLHTAPGRNLTVRLPLKVSITK